MKKSGEDHWGDDEPSVYAGEANKDKEGMLGGSFCRICHTEGHLHTKDCPKNN